MGITTFSQFRNAMRSPEFYLRTLRDIEPDPASVTTRKYFAECSALRGSRPVLIYAPTALQSMEYIERAEAALRRTGGALGKLEIIRDELISGGARPAYADLIIEPIVEGTLLREAIHTFSYDHLMRGLEELRERLRHHDISHNHLYIGNITIDRNYIWHPFRSYYTTEGYGGDMATLDHLASLIEEYALRDSVAGDYRFHEPLSAYLTHSEDSVTRYELHEYRRRFASSRGVGFEDEKGRVVISDEFHSATDFSEDRAIVTTRDHKMGIIDRNGYVVIAPIYDHLEFSLEDGVTVARSGDITTRFDYFGDIIEERS